MTSQTIGNSTTRSAQATDFRKVLTYFFKKHNPSSVSKVDKLLNRYEGKESKLMLLLAKKYDCSNPLNRVFIDSVCEANCDASNDEYYLALTTLYLSIFYPQDANQAEALCATYKGKEEEMYKKLSSNFHAINPLKMKKKTSGEGDESIYERPIDYKKVLTGFYDKHDTDKVSDVDSILRKCKGREATLFSVFALKYSTSNALNAVFEDRLKDMIECKDHITLLKLYLSVFHPSCMPDAKLMLSKYQGKEEVRVFLHHLLFLIVTRIIIAMLTNNTHPRYISGTIRKARHKVSSLQSITNLHQTRKNSFGQHRRSCRIVIRR